VYFAQRISDSQHVAIKVIQRDEHANMEVKEANLFYLLSDMLDHSYCYCCYCYYYYYYCCCCCLKPLPPSNIFQAVENEIALQKLSSGHKNVVDYYDTYLTANELWVVMEYVPGGSLTTILMYARFNEAQIAYVCREALGSLAFLHSENRVHRDIKSGTCVCVCVCVCAQDRACVAVFLNFIAMISLSTTH
jgi:serine/threonine protein kinase